MSDKTPPRKPEEKAFERALDLMERIAKRMDDVEFMLRQHSRLLPVIVRHLTAQGVELPPPYDLAAGRFGLYSQNEEDGIILSIFKRAGVTNRRFVEIGCGVNGGNSGFLARDLGWSGLMVDLRKGAVEKVRLKYAGHAVQAVRHHVTRESINPFLSRCGYAGEIDFLSIDIDGNDYWVWEALTVTTPRLVAMEYNWLLGAQRAVTVPYDPEFSIDESPTRSFRGASMAALVHLGRRKGYRLVAGERVNAFFLRNDVAPEIPEIPADRAYRHPGNEGKDPFEKIKRAGLELVEVGPPIPPSVPAIADDEAPA